MKGDIQATIIFWIGIVIGVTIVASSVLPQIFTTTTTNAVIENNLSATENLVNYTINSSRQTSVTTVWNNTGLFTLTNTSNGFVVPTTSYTFLANGTVKMTNSSINNPNVGNLTNLTISYSYPNRITYSWDSGSQALWTLVALSMVVLLLLIVLGMR